MSDTHCLRCKNAMRSPEDIVRERERPPDAFWGVEGAERMGWGPILARKKRDLGCLCMFC